MESSSLSGEQNHLPCGIALNATGQDRFDGFEDRLSFEKHAFAAPKRPVVDCAVPIMGPISQVMQANIDETGSAGAFHHAEVEGSSEEIGKESEDVENHRWPRRASFKGPVDLRGCLR